MEMPNTTRSRLSKRAATRGTKGGELMRATEVTRVVSPSRWSRRAKSICNISEPKMMKRMYHRMLRLPVRSSWRTSHALAMVKQKR